MKKDTLTWELLAEFAGTCILILFGVGVVAQVVTGNGTQGDLSLIHISEPTRRLRGSRMPSSA